MLSFHEKWTAKWFKTVYNVVICKQTFLFAHSFSVYISISLTEKKLDHTPRKHMGRGWSRHYKRPCPPVVVYRLAWFFVLSSYLFRDMDERLDQNDDNRYRSSSTLQVSLCCLKISFFRGYKIRTVYARRQTLVICVTFTIQKSSLFTGSSLGGLTHSVESVVFVNTDNLFLTCDR